MKYCNFCMNPLEDEDKECPFCGKSVSSEVPAHHLTPGSILNNKFYVGASIGEGGFGITYIGRDITLDMKVAIKEYYPTGYVNRNNTVSLGVLDSETLSRKDFFVQGKASFLREARILAKFSGEPGIVDVRDFFEDNNTAYIVMEYLDGETLKEYLKAKKTLTPGQTLKLMMPIMLSLKEVHKQGLIHRDISPDNIILVGNNVKLLDFGSARNVTAIANRSLSVMLKPGYAPEEQYRSKGDQGAWTDVYAICATMYRCITGIIPDDSVQRLYKDELKAPTALGIEINPDIEHALLKGLSVLQKDRYQSIEELLDGFRGIDRIIDQDHEVTVYARHKVSEDDIETQYIAPSEIILDAEITSVTIDGTTADKDERSTCSESPQPDAKSATDSKFEIAPEFHSETKPERVTPLAPKAGFETGTKSKIKPELRSMAGAKPKKKRVSVIAASAVLLIVAIVGIYMLVRGIGNDATTNDPVDTKMSTTATVSTNNKKVTKIIATPGENLDQEMIGKVEAEEQSFSGKLRYAVMFPLATKENSVDWEHDKILAFAGHVDENEKKIDGIVTIYNPENYSDRWETHEGQWKVNSTSGLSLSNMLDDGVFTGHFVRSASDSTYFYTFINSTEGPYLSFGNDYISCFYGNRNDTVKISSSPEYWKNDVLELTIRYQATSNNVVEMVLVFDRNNGDLYALEYDETNKSKNLFGRISGKISDVDSVLGVAPIKININNLYIGSLKEFSDDVIANKVPNLQIHSKHFESSNWGELFEKGKERIQLGIYLLRCIYNDKVIETKYLKDYVK